jgi:hypothetical protein
VKPTKQKFWLVVAIDGGEPPKFRDRVGRWAVRCRESLFRESEAVWKAKAVELAQKHGFEIGDRWARWPEGFTHRACVYRTTDFGRKEHSAEGFGRCSSPFYFPAKPL